ncbi:MAG TPA: DUF4333 domain-containing protein [Acidimicrobiia bacterium]
MQDTPRKRVPLTIVFALLASVGAGCSFSAGSSNEIDAAKAERFVKAQVDRAFPTTIHVGAASCPGGVKEKKHTAFTCSVKVENGLVRVELTQLDDKGTVKITRTNDAVLDAAKLQQTVVAKFDEQTGQVVTAKCTNRRYLVAAVGSTFDCKVTNQAGKTTQVAITVKDSDGNVQIHSPGFA